MLVTPVFGFMIKCTQTQNVALPAPEKKIDFCVYLSVTQQFRANGTPNRKSNVRAMSYTNENKCTSLTHLRKMTKKILQLKCSLSQQ